LTGQALRAKENESIAAGGTPAPGHFPSSGITDITCTADRQARVRVMAGVPVRAVVAALDDPGTVPDDPEMNILGPTN